MERRKGRATAAPIVAELKRRGVEVGASAPEPADDNMAICAMFGITKSTLKRWRDDRRFPNPDFTIGLREFTWRSRIMAWIGEQPTSHPLKGRRPAVKTAENAA